MAEPGKRLFDEIEGEVAGAIAAGIQRYGGSADPQGLAKFFIMVLAEADLGIYRIGDVMLLQKALLKAAMPYEVMQ